MLTNLTVSLFNPLIVTKVTKILCTLKIEWIFAIIWNVSVSLSWNLECDIVRQIQVVILIGKVYLFAIPIFIQTKVNMITENIWSMVIFVIKFATLLIWISSRLESSISPNNFIVYLRSSIDREIHTEN